MVQLGTYFFFTTTIICQKKLFHDYQFASEIAIVMHTTKKVLHNFRKSTYFFFIKPMCIIMKFFYHYLFDYLIGN